MSKRRGKGGKVKTLPQAPSVCRDCGENVKVARFEFFKAARPRCPKCGGSLDYQGSWRGTR